MGEGAYNQARERCDVAAGCDRDRMRAVDVAGELRDAGASMDRRCMWTDAAGTDKNIESTLGMRSNSRNNKRK